jgi:hypothetical protein
LQNEFGQSVVVDNELQRAWKESLYKSDRIGKSWAGKKGNADSRAPITRNVPEWLRIEGRVYNGSKVVDPGKTVKIPERVASVREAFRLASRGVGCNHIARQIDWCLSLSWLIRTLQNRAVLGE